MTVVWSSEDPRSVDVPNQFIVVEAFADGAGEEHVQSDHFKAAMAWWPEAIARKPEIVNVQVPQDGWGEMTELTLVAPSAEARLVRSERQLCAREQGR